MAQQLKLLIVEIMEQYMEHHMHILEVTRKGEAMLSDQTAAYEKAKRELALFQNKVDRQIASLRDSCLLYTSHHRFWPRPPAYRSPCG